MSYSILFERILELYTQVPDCSYNGVITLNPHLPDTEQTT